MKDVLPVDELEELANQEIGEAMRLTRVYYGRSLDDVEKALRIRACQIEAIEKGDMDKLPGRVYAIGFVRAYAEYLGLDGGHAVKLFKTQYMDGQAQSSLSFYVPINEMKLPTIWMLTLTLILLSVVISVWDREMQPDRSMVQDVTDIPENISDHVTNELINIRLKPIVVDSDQNTDEDSLSASETAASETAPVEDMGQEEGVQKTGIILSILDNSWVEIKDSFGNVLVSEILQKGDQYFVPDSPGLSMSLGNAANVEIFVDGRALLPLGEEGDVRRDIPLNTAYLKTLVFKDEHKSLGVEGVQ